MGRVSLCYSTVEPEVAQYPNLPAENKDIRPGKGSATSMLTDIMLRTEAGQEMLHLDPVANRLLQAVVLQDTTKHGKSTDKATDVDMKAIEDLARLNPLGQSEPVSYADKLLELKANIASGMAAVQKDMKTAFATEGVVFAMPSNPGKLEDMKVTEGGEGILSSQEHFKEFAATYEKFMEDNKYAQHGGQLKELRPPARTSVVV